ncbi:MAG: hypothetical protein RLY59_716 [Actinomycetota bacterium]|jgi:hypothetical protein
MYVVSRNYRDSLNNQQPIPGFRQSDRKSPENGDQSRQFSSFDR